jgi:3',5'-nucleoside bisphosphate phosphatase
MKKHQANHMSISQTDAGRKDENGREGLLSEQIYLDLHTHSDSSDGSDTPDELIAKARKKQCEYIAITDHDNIDHVARVTKVPENIRYIPGVEISAEFPKTLHILGYGFDPGDQVLSTTLKELQVFRKNRNEAMVSNMKAQGFDISMDELLREAGGDQIGRPNFASLMLKKGYVQTKQEAFDRYLAKGKPLYMEKHRLQPGDAIRLILNAGGIPVMAHPYQTGLEGRELEALVKELRDLGLQGIEAYYQKHQPKETQAYLHLAKKYDLLITAGSDYHGKNKTGVPLGMRVPKSDLRPFLEILQ